jgi:hypothetical protein
MVGIICYDPIVIKANQVIPGVVAEVVRKAPLTDEKVAFAWRLAVGAAVAKATAHSTSPPTRRPGTTRSVRPSA